jgi:septum site-determining protein MinC
VTSRAEAEAQAARRTDPAPAPRVEAAPEPAPQADAPKLIAGPVRSGVVLEVPGNVVIVGDVNPGAEVVSAGNIVVLGTLRGIAHAACAGDAGFVLALQLAPQQLRIGSLIARAGDADSAAHGAEIAYAKDGQIIVETYRGKLPSGLGIGTR